MSKEEEFFQTLYEIADTVIEIKEVSLEDAYRHDVFKTSMKHVEEFFKQINNRMLNCENEEDIIFVKESTLNFLIFSLKKVLSDWDMPDENIDYMADHLSYQIKTVTRREHEKANK
jgi:hypothetical protein